MTEPQLPPELEKRFDKLMKKYDWHKQKYGVFTEWEDDEYTVTEMRLDILHFLATALEEQRATFVDEVKNRKATIKWLWGKQKTDDECFLMVMEQVQKIADILNRKDTNE